MRASCFLLRTTLIILFSRFDTQASGVAEPKLLRELFQEAEAAGWPIMQYIRLENMVTVVDSSLFTELYMSDDKIEDRPELGLGDGADDAEEDAEDDIPDWMTGSSWAGAAAAQGPSGGVVQLLTEQVEIADVLVANKVSSHKFSQAPLALSIVFRSCQPPPSTPPPIFSTPHSTPPICPSISPDVLSASDTPSPPPAHAHISILPPRPISSHMSHSPPHSS